jgi:hypothetical protein
VGIIVGVASARKIEKKFRAMAITLAGVGMPSTSLLFSW